MKTLPNIPFLIEDEGVPICLLTSRQALLLEEEYFWYTKQCEAEGETPSGKGFAKFLIEQSEAQVVESVSCSISTYPGTFKRYIETGEFCKKEHFK